MEHQIKKELESIRDKVVCHKDFKCIASDLLSLCEAQDIGADLMLECLEENPDECEFSFAFYGYSYLCECPMRVYISKILKK